MFDLPPVSFEELSFGIIRNAPLVASADFKPQVLSFGNLVEGGGGAILSFGHGDIALSFRERFGEASPFHWTLESRNPFDDIESDQILRWSEVIRNPERVAFLTDTFGIENITDICIYAADIPSKIETSNAVHDPLEQTFIMDSVMELDGFSDRSSIIFDMITDPKHDILVCSLDDGSDGRFYAEQAIINVNYKHSPDSGIPFVETSDDLFLERYKHALITSFEEAGHAYYEMKRPETRLDEQTPYRSVDTILFWLAEEAAVKVGMAVDAVREVYELGDNALFDAMEQQNNGESDMVVYLLKQVHGGGGYKALENPDFLFQTFTLFFKNDVSMAQYHPFYSTNEIDSAIASNTSQKPIPVERLASAYGMLIGDEDAPNFITGRIESMNDLLILMPEASDMRQWLESVLVHPSLQEKGVGINPELPSPLPQ